MTLTEAEYSHILNKIGRELELLMKGKIEQEFKRFGPITEMDKATAHINISSGMMASCMRRFQISTKSDDTKVLANFFSLLEDLYNTGKLEDERPH